MNEKANALENDAETPAESQTGSELELSRSDSAGESTRLVDIAPARSPLLMTRHDSAILVIDVQQLLFLLIEKTL